MNQRTALTHDGKEGELNRKPFRKEQPLKGCSPEELSESLDGIEGAEVAYLSECQHSVRRSKNRR